MKPTPFEKQIFEDMKKTFGTFGLPITDEGQADNYLFFNSRLFGSTPISENDLSIGYETRGKTIRIVARTFHPVPQGRKGDLLELFNYLNLRMANVRLNIDPTTQLVQLRGEMDLFGGPLDRKNFEDVLKRFFTAVKKFFPLIVAYLKGHIKKDDIQNQIDADIKARQRVSR
jgi:hypothetical protein